MVNTLSGSVSAYRKEIVKPRFIRIDEVMALLDVTRDEAMDIALAAGARYQLAKIILVHKERLMKFMKHFARVPSSNKIVEKKFVRIGEASMTYSIGHHRFIEMARAAGAVYKIGTAKGTASGSSGNAGGKPVRNPEREKPKWEDTITNRMLHWSYTPEQKEELKMALAAGIPRATILTYFYPEVTVEKMSSYRKKQ